MKTFDGTVRRCIGWFAPLTLLVLATGVRAEDPRWTQARTLETQERWAEAGEVYAAILAAEPTSQEAAVKRAVCQLEAGLAAQAADTLETAVDMAPNTYWAGVGLYYQADACHRADCHQVARDAIARLKAGFPGLIWTTRAEIIEARLDGLGEAPFETAFARETEADGLYREALRLAKDRDDPGALEVLDEVWIRYPDTRTALAALHSEANVLSRDKSRTDAAMKAFQEVLADLRENAPQSMMRFEAQRGVAALYQRLDMPEEAMKLYAGLAGAITDPRLRAEALLQQIGAYNETLQRRVYVGEAVTADDWDDLRRACAAARAGPAATPFQQARFDLIVTESLYWQSRLPEALEQAEKLIATHGPSVDRRAVATAHFIAGECLFFRERYAEALPHFEWIAKEFGDEEIWGALKDAYPHRESNPAELARLHYDIFLTRQALDDPDEDLAALAEEYLGKYGASKYAGVVRGWLAGYRNSLMQEGLR